MNKFIVCDEPISAMGMLEDLQEEMYLTYLFISFHRLRHLPLCRMGDMYLGSRWRSYQAATRSAHTPCTRTKQTLLQTLHLPRPRVKSLDLGGALGGCWISSWVVSPLLISLAKGGNLVYHRK